MRRFAFILLMLTFTFGCATKQRPEQVNGMNLDQQLNTYIDDYYAQVVGLCIEIQGKANARKSVVGCAVRERTMHVSFPSKAYHQEHLEDIAQLYNHWCAAYGSKTGTPGAWMIHFRQEEIRVGRTCQRRTGS
jgi:hypothetical protein